MRTILTFLLALGCTVVSAQKFMIGLHGGLQVHSAPIGSPEHFDGFQKLSSPAFGGKIGIGLGKLQLGLGVIYAEINASYAMKMPDIKHGTNLIGTYYDYSSEIFNPYLFVNLKKDLGPLQLFYGINLGYTFIGTSSTEVSWTQNKWPMGSKYVPAVNAMSAGLQFGGRFGLFKGLGVFLEGGARYNTASYEMPTHDYSQNYTGTYTGSGFLSFPMLAGLDYRL
jgi:hypothetical protein